MKAACCCPCSRAQRRPHSLELAMEISLTSLGSSQTYRAAAARRWRVSAGMARWPPSHPMAVCPPCAGRSPARRMPAASAA